MTTQVEGAIVYGLTAALCDKITIKNGRAEQSTGKRIRSRPLRDHGFITA